MPRIAISAVSTSDSDQSGIAARIACSSRSIRAHAWRIYCVKATRSSFGGSTALNYQDICETIREFMQRGVVIRTVINGITFDGATKEPMQCAVRDALIAFMAATALAQAEATKEAQRAGIAHVKANGDGRAYKGRKPSYSRKQFEDARALLGKSNGVAKVARVIGLTRQTVYRIKDDPVSAEAALASWGI
jgi:putative DNA-invertase from lambdoid prophage Rac